MGTTVTQVHILLTPTRTKFFQQVMPAQSFVSSTTHQSVFMLQTQLDVLLKSRLSQMRLETTFVLMTSMRTHLKEITLVLLKLATRGDYELTELRSILKCGACGVYKICGQRIVTAITNLI